MASTTIDIDTELSAVNNILGAIGQAPLTTLNFENPEVSFIFNLLRDANVDTQAEGWHFNTEKHVEYPINSAGKIAIPNDVLSLDLHDNYTRRTSDLVRRNGFLYDKINHTDVFTSNLSLDVVKLYSKYIKLQSDITEAVSLLEEDDESGPPPCQQGRLSACRGKR